MSKFSVDICRGLKTAKATQLARTPEKPRMLVEKSSGRFSIRYQRAKTARLHMNDCGKLGSRS